MNRTRSSSSSPRERSIVFSFHGYPGGDPSADSRAAQCCSFPRARLQGRGRGQADAIRHGRSRRDESLPHRHGRNSSIASSHEARQRTAECMRMLAKHTAYIMNTSKTCRRSATGRGQANTIRVLTLKNCGTSSSWKRALCGDDVELAAIKQIGGGGRRRSRCRRHRRVRRAEEAGFADPDSMDVASSTAARVTANRPSSTKRCWRPSRRPFRSRRCICLQSCAQSKRRERLRQSSSGRVLRHHLTVRCPR